MQFFFKKKYQEKLKLVILSFGRTDLYKMLSVTCGFFLLNLFFGLNFLICHEYIVFFLPSLFLNIHIKLLIVSHDRISLENY